MPVNSFIEKPLSWIPSSNISKDSSKYLSLAAELENDIRSGKLPSGSKLPPQRELADFLDINFTTVTRAYSVCREKGLIYGITGRGTFVSTIDNSKETLNTFNCAVVQGFCEISADKISSAAIDVISRTSPAELFSYSNRDGSPRSRTAGQNYLKQNRIVLPAEQIGVFPGAQGAISAALLSLFNAGDKIAVDEFTYANFISLSRLAKIKLVPIQNDGKGMLPNKLEQAVRDFNIKGVYLMPNAANPTGITLSEKRKNELAAVIKTSNLILIEDDATLLFGDGGLKPLFKSLPNRTLYIAGSTRYIAPGLRATFVAYPKAFASSLLSAMHHITIKAGILDAEILSEIVLSGKAKKILQEKAKKARAANNIFNKIFPNAFRPEDTLLFRTIPLPHTAGQGQEIEKKCRKAGVEVCHSDRFSVRPGLENSFIRVSLSSLATLSELKDALKLLKKTLF